MSQEPNREEIISNVCIIEDEPEINEALTTYLKSAKYNVESFFSAEQFYDGIDSSFRGVFLKYLKSLQFV